MSHQENKSRRQFLENSIKSLSLLGVSSVLSNSIVQTLMESAHAAETVGVGSKKIYIYFSFDGGPPRWMFDLPLTPNGSSDLFTPGGFGTYVGTTNRSPEALHQPWQDPNSQLWLPPVWGSRPGGGAFNIVNNAFFIRGLDGEINNHEVNRMRNQAPILGGTSIAGSLSELMTVPFPAVVSNSIGSVFKATKPIAPVTVSYEVNGTNGANNPVSRVMSYFSGSKPIANPNILNALYEFDQYSKSIGVSQHTLRNSKDRADELLNKGVSAFTSQWSAVYTKYQNRIKEAMVDTNTSSFMSTQAIPLPPLGSDGNPDGRTTIGTNMFLANTMTDMRNLVQDTTTVNGMAATFATMEIMIVNGLTQIYTCSLDGLSNIKRDGGTATFGMANDQHFIGSLVSTIATTFYYRAILNCVEELVSVLKQKELFGDTVIQFGSEFNRNPKTIGTGSDHGPAGSSALVISGMIEKAVVIGNIRKDTNANSIGTWGLSAGHPATNNKPFRLNDVVKTVCALLGIENVSNNGEYLLANNGGGKWGRISGVKGEAKNVS